MESTGYIRQPTQAYSRCGFESRPLRHTVFSQNTDPAYPFDSPLEFKGLAAVFGVTGLLSLCYLPRLRGDPLVFLSSVICGSRMRSQLGNTDVACFFRGPGVSSIRKLFADEGHDAQVAMHDL